MNYMQIIFKKEIRHERVKMKENMEGQLEKRTTLFSIIWGVKNWKPTDLSTHKDKKKLTLDRRYLEKTSVEK